MSEYSSFVRLESVDDEVSPSGNESMADYLVGSSEREPSANPSEEDEEVASPLRQNFREFVLPRIWVVNKFPPKMMKEVFRRLHPLFQIPDDVPIRRANRREKCYLREAEDIGFYEVASQ